MDMKAMGLISIVLLILFAMHYALFQSLICFFAVTRPWIKALLYTAMVVLTYGMVVHPLRQVESALAELAGFRDLFTSDSYFLVLAGSGHYYFADADSGDEDRNPRGVKPCNELVLPGNCPCDGGGENHPHRPERAECDRPARNSQPPHREEYYCRREQRGGVEPGHKLETPI